MKVFLSGGAFVFVLYISVGCKTQTVQKVPTDFSVTYTSDIKAIIDTNCASSCHSSFKKAHHLDLSTYELVKEEASKKDFLGAIKHEKGFEEMPKKHPKLADATILKIETWIKNGSPK
jgi:hypothetical protein